MEVGVEVRWPGNRRSGWFTTRHPRCSYNTPILVFDGAARRPSELDPDIEVIVPWIAKFGPEQTMIQKAIDAGYPIKMESTEEQKMQAYCMKCRKRVKTPPGASILKFFHGKK